jgi:hypothetical protein
MQVSMYYSFLASRPNIYIQYSDNLSEQLRTPTPAKSKIKTAEEEPGPEK